MVKVSQGIQGDTKPDWVTFGPKYMINQKLLDKNSTLLIKYQTYSPIMWLPRRKINAEFKNFMQELLDTNTINYGLLKLCLENDVRLFADIINKGQLTKTLNFQIENAEPSIEDLRERYNILKGEIVAGNDNPELKPKCKDVILQLFKHEVFDELTKNELIEAIDEM